MFNRSSYTTYSPDGYRALSSSIDITRSCSDVTNGSVDVTDFGSHVLLNLSSRAGDRTFRLSAWHAVLTCSILALIILATIIGNVLVIAAIVLERNLQNVANYLIALLAVADLLVAILVMPLAAVKDVSPQWFLGREICDMWISFDVLCCTSSILHLVAISVDRYWAVTRVDYIHNRPVRLIIAMIALSWAISTVICIPPLFGWRDPLNNPDETGECLISQDWGYTIYSTVGAFYLPLVIMIIIYMNVYRAARLRIRKKQFRSSMTSSCKGSSSAATASGGGKSRFGICSSSPTVDSPTSPNSLFQVSTPFDGSTSGVNGNATSNETGNSTYATTSPTSLVSAYEFPEPLQWSDPTALLPESSFQTKEQKAREKREQTRERKAARTLAIITGSFVGCWLPFFILALVGPFCGKHCSVPPLLASSINWLGYCNSLLNPVIYTIFNADFRSAFRKILFGKYRHKRAASRFSSTSYTNSSHRRI